MSPADETTPLIVYIRQSRAKERTISLDDQRKSIHAWAKANNVKLGAEVVEQGVSGSKSWRERALGQAVEQCQNGEAAGIIVAFQDRLSRENGIGTAEVYEALDSAGARLVASSEGLDTAAGDQEMLFTIKAAIAREQWKRHRLNWANAKHASWEAGRYLANLPAGYDRDVGGGLVQNEHAPVIRRVFELRTARPRATWGEVAQVLAGAGVLTSRLQRGEWANSSLRYLIANQVYTGLHACTCGCGESVVRPEWEIVPGWLWRKAQTDKAAAPEVPVRNGDGHPLGAGLVRCVCGAGLTRSNSPAGAMLRCAKRGSGHVAILYEPARDWVLLEVARYIGAMKLDDGNESERAEAEQAVVDAKAALAEVEAMLATAAPAKSAPVLALRAAEDALAEIRRPEGFDLGSVLTPLGIKQHIESLPAPEQRRALKSVVSRVVLLKDKGTAQEQKQVREGTRHPAQSRLRIEFVDGSVSPADHDWEAISAQIAEELATEDDEAVAA
jgi:DNA invertase Pin-like site-specific DNA recombinase